MVGLTFAADIPQVPTEAVAALDPSLLDKVWWIPALPFFAFLLIIFVTRRFRMGSALLSIAALSGACLIAFLTLAARMAHPEAPPQVWQVDWINVGSMHVTWGCLVDNQSAAMLVVVTFIGALIQIYSTGYMNHEPDFPFAKFFSYLSLFTASMLMLVLAPNFVQIYMGWELVGLCSYLLIGFWYFKNSAADAAKKAFVVTRFGDLGFLMGILMVFFLTGSVAFVGPESCLAKMAAFGAGHPQLLTLACVLVFCGAIGKSAQFPLHIWLPDAMEGPTPVSALIHAATMVAAGVYMVARTYDMFAASHDALQAVAWIGAITAFMAATMGVVNNDIKRVMAYSTVSQLGYMFMALGIGTSAAYTAGNFHLVTHAFFKALLFLCCGSVIHAVSTNNMWEMGGLKKYMPITHFTFLMGALALSGIPPFSGFWSKDAILGAAWEHNAALAVVGYASAFLTAFYVARCYLVTFQGTYRGAAAAEIEDHGHAAAHGSHNHHGGTPHENPLTMTGPLMVLAFFAVVIGFVNAEPFTKHFADFIHHGAEGAAEASYLPMIVSIVIAALGWAVGIGLYASKPVENEALLKKQFAVIWRVLENKWYMDDIWAWLLKNTMFLGANVCDWIDRKVIDGCVFGVGRAALFVGEMLREEHSGKVQQYAMMIAIALVVIVMGVGVAEPSFVLSPPSILKGIQALLHPGTL